MQFVSPRKGGARERQGVSEGMWRPRGLTANVLDTALKILQLIEKKSIYIYIYDLISGEPLFLTCQQPPPCCGPTRPLLHAQGAGGGGDVWSGVCSSLDKGTGPISTFMMLLILPCPLKALLPNTVTLGLGLHQMNWGGTQFRP